MAVFFDTPYAEFSIARRIDKALNERTDIARILERLGSNFTTDRNDLFAQLCDLLENQYAAITEEEKELILNMLWRLTEEIELSLRIRIADRLADRPEAPHELVRMLAHDDIRVAHNLLVHGQALRDPDLIEIVKNRGKRHSLAITARRNISEAVADALVETNDRDVIVGLLNNEKALISKTTLSYLVDESRRVDEFQRPLVRRHDLPPELARRLCAWVAEELLEMLGHQHAFDAAALRRELDIASNEIAIELEEEPPNELALVKQLSATGELTAGFLNNALKQGHVTLFEYGLAMLAQIGREQCLNFIYNFGENGLSVICAAAGIDDRGYLSIRRLIQQSRGQSTSESLADREVLLHRYNTIKKANMRRTMAILVECESHGEFEESLRQIVQT